MNSNQIFAVFVGVIMILSTVGFALWSVSNQQDSFDQPVDGTGQQPDQNLITINFAASNVNAKVSDLFSSVRISALAKEFNIDKIDSAIYNIEGIKKVSSKFSNVQEGLVYVATISFESDLAPGEVIQKIRGAAKLDVFEAYVFALVELPKRIVFESENKDLNLQKEYEFGENLNFSNALLKLSTMEGLDSLNPQKGDFVLVNLSVVFKGASLSELSADSTENLTAKPVFGETILELPIVSLSPTVFFSAKEFFSSQADSNNLKQQISAMADVNSVEAIDVPSVPAKIIVSDKNILQEEKVHDFNVLVQALNPQRIDFSNETEFSANIVFDSDANLLDSKAKIQKIVSDIGLPSALVEENSAEIFAKISLKKTDTKEFSSVLQKLLESNALSEIKLRQLGDIGIEKIFNSDKNAFFTIDSNKAESVLSIGHSIGEKVNAKISYYIIRDKIAEIQGEEQ